MSRAQALRRELIELAAAWDVTPIGPDVVDRARASFPDDRIRALDAIHLASAMTARANLGPIDLLTLDDRIRAIGQALGFRVLPA
jgi:predicted nucleic acid-binding protein